MEFWMASTVVLNLVSVYSTAHSSDTDLAKRKDSSSRSSAIFLKPNHAANPKIDDAHSARKMPIPKSLRPKSTITSVSIASAA
jgi:hypothetical protein